MNRVSDALPFVRFKKANVLLRENIDRLEEFVSTDPRGQKLMAYYLHLGFKPDSPVQYPERLFRQKKLMALVAVTFLACALLLFVDLPALGGAFRPLIVAE